MNITRRTRYGFGLQVLQNQPKQSQQTMISNQSPQKSPQISKQNRQCRICLQNAMQSPQKKFISPCQCHGSLQFVHQSCITEWLLECYKKKSLRQSIQAKKQGIACELCKAKIKFQVQSEWGCNNCEQFCTIVHQKKCLFIAVIIFIVISLGGSIFAIYSLTAGDAKFTVQESNLKLEVILALCGGFLMLMFFIISIYTMIMDFALKYQRYITGVGKHRLGNNRVYPEDPSQVQIQQLE